jgi:hypothetical protein
MKTQTNLTDVDADSIVIADDVQALTGDGAITISRGVATLTKAGVLVATLNAPQIGHDDFNRLTIVSLGTAGSAHTVSGISGALTATFSNVIGDSLDLMAFNGVWYVLGKHQVTIA